MVWSAVSGIVGVLVGLILGHWLSLGRDKRKEFNEATVNIRERLASQLEGLKETAIPEGVNASEISKVVALLGESEAANVTKAFNRYAATLEMCSMRREKWGVRHAVSPGCMKEIKRDIEALYKAVQPK